jgi:catechol 2,3-dioxygenase-like lactoylglutathione lyase family enzyme
MSIIAEINHVTLIVDNLEKAAEFYEKEMGLEPIPAFQFDYPVMFYKITDTQQLHLSEWEDKESFRGHVCFKVNNWSKVFHRCKELGIIDITPWGKVRKLTDGAMQMFVRDPSGNLVELSSMPDSEEIDPAIFEDELYAPGIYVSGRNDFRGYKSDDATLYHGKKD